MRWVVRGMVITVFMLMASIEAGVPIWASLPIGILLAAFAARSLPPQNTR